MQAATSFLIAYAVNSLWLVPLLFLAAEMIVRILGRTRGRVLCRVWWMAMALAVIVPALTFVRVPLRAASVVPPVVHVATENRPQLHFSAASAQPESVGQVERAFWKLPGVVPTCILYLYLGTIIIAIVRLGRGLWQTHALVRSAGAAELNEELRETWERCQLSMGVRDGDVRICSTSVLGSPATLHWPRPIILMPAKLESADSAEMSAVFCHELAHVFRKDFIWNIAFEVFGVLLFYHPAFHWMRHRIQEARELACDDMAAEAMRGRSVYARNLLSLTQKMLSAAVVPQPGCALGIFEGEVLERRIMNLLGKRSQFPVVRVVASAVLGTCLIIVAAFAIINFGLGPAYAQSVTPASQSVAPVNHAPAGWFLGNSAQYESGVDKSAVNNGQPSAFLASKTANIEGFGTLLQEINATEYAGKRIRLRAWVKSENVADWAGVWMRVDKGRDSVAFDNMQNRAIKGSQPWAAHDVVLDVPQDATRITFGILLSKTGEVWMNDVTFEVVGEDVPVTSAMPKAPKLPDHPTNLKFTE